ncbi:MAG: 5'/3'-nucleotidase SurE [Bdellovibrionota bacterium]|nr:MAG: 5'/3'-nucleotidase SurE [Bdellovibrionota bacterium]
MKILLTNDDSHQSPLLQFAIEALSPLGDLTIVVPLEEQSWKGKSMTRFGTVHEGETVVAGRVVRTLSGTPADCVNIAIYHYGRPDFVVSGINAGLNVGASFVLASGTVGACFEANIAGIPALAWSQEFDRSLWKGYTATYSLPEEVVTHLRAQTTRVARTLFPAFTALLAQDRSAYTWNVNMPHMLSNEPSLEGATLARNQYFSCFSRGEFGFQHQLVEVKKGAEAQCDDQVLLRGHVPVTRFSLSPWSALPGLTDRLPIP